MPDVATQRTVVVSFSGRQGLVEVPGTVHIHPLRPLRFDQTLLSALRCMSLSEEGFSVCIKTEKGDTSIPIPSGKGRLGKCNKHCSAKDTDARMKTVLREIAAAITA
jgi:hypothetical protein